MRIFTTGLILLAVASSAACASEVADSGDAATGGTGTGGAGTGGAVIGTGGTVAGTGGSVIGTGGTVAGTGGTTSTKVDCAEGTVVATATPTVLAWELNTAAASTDDSSVGASGPVTVTSATPGSPTSTAYIAAVLSTWAESGRECVDVSAFTGVKFDVSATTSDIIFKVGVSAADEAGSCVSGCYANPSVAVTPGTNVQVPFSSLVPATWGVMAPFNNKQVVSLIWATSDATVGKTITVSNVSFY